MQPEPGQEIPTPPPVDSRVRLRAEPGIVLVVVWVDGEDVWLIDPHSRRRFTRYADQLVLI